jgi:hypothetical protein
MNTFKQSPLEKGFNFEIRTVEWLTTNRRLPDNLRRYPDFRVIWVTKGSGEYCIDIEKHPIKDDTVYFVPAGRMQQLKAGGEITGYILSFSSDFLYLSTASPSRVFYEELLTAFSRVSILAIEEDRIKTALSHLLKEMITEFESYLLLRSEILSGLLKIFLIHLQRLADLPRQEMAPSKIVNLFNNFSSKVDKYFLTKRMVSDYASELSVTPSYLTEVVKRVTGYSASYHIQQRMVLEAKRLAMYSDANMKMIAYKLGFDDVSHFSKFFKNVAGMNFTEFKKTTSIIN